MLSELLFFNIGHFALSVFTAFVFFAAGLLFLDSWQIDKLKKTPLIRSVGFFLLSISFGLHATSIDASLLITALQFLKVFGLILILISLVKEPILHPPYAKASEGQKPPKKGKLAIFFPLSLPALSLSLIPLSSVLMLLIAIWYFRRLTEGLDKQLKGASIAFFLLSLGEFLRISSAWSVTSNVFWSKILSDYSFIWNLQHLFEAGGIVILALWVFGYIRFRLQIQLFVVTFASTLLIFLVTTFFFTFILLKNLEEDALSHLKTDVNVLQYALDRLQLETLSHARAIAQDSDFKQAFTREDSEGLYTITSNFMLLQNTNFLNVASSSGEVLIRAEDRERKGDNIAYDPVVKSALAGLPLATIVSKEGITSPEVLVKAAIPIKKTNSSSVAGIVSTGFVIDSAFVDGVKDITGLDAAVFGGNKRAATTFVAPDGKSRYVGTLETNKNILKKVLEKGEVYIGASNVLNQPYYTAYAPLKTFGGKPIGMLYVGKPQSTLYKTAQKSIDLTFLGSVILMILSIIPAYFLARYMREHLEA